MAGLQKEQQKITALLNKPSKNIGISDHALIRYLEREHGFDFTPWKEEILTPERIAMIKAGCKSINVGKTKMLVDGNRIVPVL